MDNDWTRKAARKAALDKAEAAAKLLREARDILRSNEYPNLALNIDEALEYVEEVCEA